jgi:hypothetical protein
MPYIILHGRKDIIIIIIAIIYISEKGIELESYYKYRQFLFTLVHWELLARSEVSYMVGYAEHVSDRYTSAL